MKAKTIQEVKKILAEQRQKKSAEAKPATPPQGPDVKKTFITVPYFTPSDDVDIDNVTEEQKKKLVAKGKLMAGADPITITKLTTRKVFMNNVLNPIDFTFDAGPTYRAWVYTWIYLALTILVYIFIHPLVAVPFAWKVGHNQGHYIGALIFGKEDMKGKTMYRTA